MMSSQKAVAKRLGLLTSLVAALVIACTGVVLAQGSSANAGYGNANPDTPSDADQAAPDTSGFSTTGDFSAAARVSNGSFEAGTLAGWTVENQPGGNGNWYAYSGTTSPQSGSIIAAPPNGTFAATTDQGGPGSHVLYKDIKLKRGMKHKLSFYLYYRNTAPGFTTPDSLSYNTAGLNQQYRVDVLKRSADPFSVNSSDIRAKIFRTEVGDPTTLAPQLRTFNLTRFAGKTVRLRFAEVDNQGIFLASTDRVKVKSKRR